MYNLHLNGVCIGLVNIKLTIIWTEKLPRDDNKNWVLYENQNMTYTIVSVNILNWYIVFHIKINKIYTDQLL